MNLKQKEQVIKTSVFITSIFIIFLSVTYAFINMSLLGTKKQEITAANLELELDEDENNLKIENAMPMYDEVGMLQQPFTFRLINKTNIPTEYIIKLENITIDGGIQKEDVKCGLTKNKKTTIRLVSEVEDSIFDQGTIQGNETIEYELRLWIKSDVTNIEAIQKRSLKLRMNIKAEQLTKIEVQFDENRGEEIISSKTVDIGKEYGELPILEKNNYNFLGWYTEKEGGRKIESTTIVSATSNQTLYAHWELKTCLVTFDATGGKTDMVNKKIAYGELYGSLPKPTRDNYSFIGWFTEKDGGSKIESESVVNIEGEQVLYAHWKGDSYVLTFNANGGSTSTGNKSIIYGEAYGSLPSATKAENYFFGWYTQATGGEKIENTTIVNKAGNQTLYAHYGQPPLATMKQGDYVAYVGNNGCRNNGVDTFGNGNAESKNSCLGWNANQGAAWPNDQNGHCHDSHAFKTAGGWRIAYIENNRAFLITSGAPECNTATVSDQNVDYINFANTRAKKYCNKAFVDGDCSDNADSWAINDSDFYKITGGANGGSHLASCEKKSTAACGRGNNLIDIGAYYYFASNIWYNSLSFWDTYYNRLYVSHGKEGNAYGLRPVIRLSTSVYVKGGNGTQANPYIISK